MKVGASMRSLAPSYEGFGQPQAGGVTPWPQSRSHLPDLLEREPLPPPRLHRHGRLRRGVRVAAGLEPGAGGKSALLPQSSGRQAKPSRGAQCQLRGRRRLVAAAVVAPGVTRIAVVRRVRLRRVPVACVAFCLRMQRSRHGRRGQRSRHERREQHCNELSQAHLHFPTPFRGPSCHAEPRTADRDRLTQAVPRKL